MSSFYDRGQCDSAVRSLPEAESAGLSHTQACLLLKALVTTALYDEIYMGLVIVGFPCGSAGKESAYNARDLGSIPGLGRSPREGKRYPLQYSGLENPMDCIVAKSSNYTVATESDMTSNEYSGLISFRIDRLDLLSVQGTLKSLLQHHSSKASIIRHSTFFIVQISHPYMTTGLPTAAAAAAKSLQSCPNL